MEEPEVSDSREPPFFDGSDRNLPELPDPMAAGDLHSRRGCSDDGGDIFGTSEAVPLVG